MFEDIRATYFPTELVPGITARAVDEAEVVTVWDRIADAIFPAHGDLGNYVLPVERHAEAAKLRAAQQIHSEHIVFYTAADEPVGWSSGVMLDASTFFMAYTGILPEYQRHGIYSSFLKLFLPYLHALGYERVTSNHMVNNRAVLIAKLKAGFYITGMVLDERYGAQVSLTYFFYPDRRTGFARAFSLEDYPYTPDYRRSGS